MRAGLAVPEAVTTNDPRPAEQTFWRYPAAQQPNWRTHPDYEAVRHKLSGRPPVVSWAEVAALRGLLTGVAEGDAYLLQVGDCAESIWECGREQTARKVETMHAVGDHMASAGSKVLRVGRIGGQFAKPRSQDTERIGGRDLPVFRGHLINSEESTLEARRHDPSRMLWAYDTSRQVLNQLHRHRIRDRYLSHADTVDGPWASHEALILDYEGALVDRDRETGASYLSSTHLPWIGDRTRQPDRAHVHLLAGVRNPVGCKIGPSATPAAVVELCALLDPQRRPGRLTLIARMGKDEVERVLPPIVEAVARAGHPVIWLTDPMHGNTVRSASGRKTRYLSDMIEEACAAKRVLRRHGQHAAGIHCEVASSPVTECVGGPVPDEDALERNYATLCDPRLRPEQAKELVSEWLRV
jgi:3-deoxy-7-phosphoheptulonate synthase